MRYSGLLFVVVVMVVVCCGDVGLGIKRPYLPRALADSLPPPVYSSEQLGSHVRGTAKMYRPVGSQKRPKSPGFLDSVISASAPHEIQVNDVASESSKNSPQESRRAYQDASQMEGSRSLKTEERSNRETSQKPPVEVSIESPRKVPEEETNAFQYSYSDEAEKLAEEKTSDHFANYFDGSELEEESSKKVSEGETSSSKDNCHDDSYEHGNFHHLPHRWRKTAPGRIPLPGPELCSHKEPRGLGTAPPNVCDLCPTTIDNKNPLNPCTCVGNSGTGAGKISITCPPTMATTDQIKDIFTNTDFLTTNVFRFTLRGSKVSGVLSQDLWGPLDFNQVFITNNEINHVDNQAFIHSADTLTYLDLDNNNISSYVTMGIDDLPHLQTLVLSRNRLSIIFTNHFNYSSLKLLDLSENQIESIGKNSFGALNKLETLKLNHNRLESIQDDYFNFTDHHPATNFLVIDLSYNKISSISPDGFKGLKYVQLNLQYNKLTSVPEQIYLPIINDSQHFVYFYLDGNDIECNCDLLWVVANEYNLACFDDFGCSNTNKTLYQLTPQDLGNCTDHQDKTPLLTTLS